MSTLLVLGPSGVGKSSLGAALQSFDGLLHIEFDVWGADGVDDAKLRTEWDALLGGGDPKPLTAAVNERALKAGSNGAVITLPSGVLFPVPTLYTATAAGIRPLILYGTAADCIDAFLKREQETDRNLSVEHWQHNNIGVYMNCSRPEYAPFRVQAFRDGKRRSHRALHTELKRRKFL